MKCFEIPAFTGYNYVIVRRHSTAAYVVCVCLYIYIFRIK